MLLSQIYRRSVLPVFFLLCTCSITVTVNSCMPSLTSFYNFPSVSQTLDLFEDASCYVDALLYQPLSLSLSLSIYLSLYLSLIHSLSLSLFLSLSLSLSLSFTLSLSLSLSLSLYHSLPLSFFLSLSLLSSLSLTPCFFHLLQLPTPPFSSSLSLSILPPTLYISIFHSLHKYSLFLC